MTAAKAAFKAGCTCSILRLARCRAGPSTTWLFTQLTRGPRVRRNPGAQKWARCMSERSNRLTTFFFFLPHATSGGRLTSLPREPRMNTKETLLKDARPLYSLHPPLSPNSLLVLAARAIIQFSILSSAVLSCSARVCFPDSVFMGGRFCVSRAQGRGL